MADPVARLPAHWGRTYSVVYVSLRTDIESVHGAGDSVPSVPRLAHRVVAQTAVAEHRSGQERQDRQERRKNRRHGCHRGAMGCLGGTRGRTWVYHVRGASNLGRRGQILSRIVHR